MIKSTLNILRKWNIPILDDDLGGCYGRKIIFETESDKVVRERLDSCLKNSFS